MTATAVGSCVIEARSDDGRTIIEPRDPYLDLVRQSGELTPRRFWHTPWELSFEWPTLDVKLVNNTGQTVVFHEAVFCVRESRLDARPVPVIKGIAYGMYLPLYNVGWGPMIDCKIRFKLSLTTRGRQPLLNLFGKSVMSMKSELRVPLLLSSLTPALTPIC